MLWPSIVSAIVFLILLSFGTWQIKRLFWKEALIERYLLQSQSNPIKDQAQLKDNNVDEFQAIEIYGSFLHNNEIYITKKPKMGYHSTKINKVKEEIENLMNA